VPEIHKARAAAQGLRLTGLDRRRSHPRSTCASRASAAPTSAPRRSLETCLRKTRSLPDPQACLTIGTPAAWPRSSYACSRSLRPEAEASLTLGTAFGAFRKLTFSSFTPDSLRGLAHRALTLINAGSIALHYAMQMHAKPSKTLINTSIALHCKTKGAM